MSEKEKMRMFDLYRKLDAEGRKEEAIKVGKSIPLAPHLAMALKEVCGADYVITEGFNLSEAEAKYGKGWLNERATFTERTS